MTGADPRGLEAVAECHLTEVRTIEEEIKRLASSLGFRADLDRLMLLPGTHKTIPHTASLRRLLTIVGDLLEQTHAALDRLLLARPLPKRSATMLLFAISSVQEIVREAHRVVCSRVQGEALDQLGVAVTTMRQITQTVAQSPLLAEHRDAAGGTAPS
ncbi:hypothetical protein ACFU7Y_33325 [Kitasatospora sp. NPDC057542]|uniref:hypothetical protein n=1 Tax=Kitasatospora sp. NPDC057542 TaxID=3346162 RepID=UPI003689208A